MQQPSLQGDNELAHFLRKYSVNPSPLTETHSLFRKNLV